MKRTSVEHQRLEPPKRPKLASAPATILEMPNDVIDRILSWLWAVDDCAINNFSSTNRQMRAMSDRIRRHARETDRLLSAGHLFRLAKASLDGDGDTRSPGALQFAKDRFRAMQSALDDASPEWRHSMLKVAIGGLAPLREAPDAWRAAFAGLFARGKAGTGERGAERRSYLKKLGKEVRRLDGPARGEYVPQLLCAGLEELAPEMQTVVQQGSAAALELGTVRLEKPTPEQVLAWIKSTAAAIGLSDEARAVEYTKLVLEAIDRLDEAGQRRARKHVYSNLMRLGGHPAATSCAELALHNVLKCAGTPIATLPPALAVPASCLIAQVAEPAKTALFDRACEVIGQGASPGIVSQLLRNCRYAVNAVASVPPDWASNFSGALAKAMESKNWSATALKEAVGCLPCLPVRARRSLALSLIESLARLRSALGSDTQEIYDALWALVSEVGNHGSAKQDRTYAIKLVKPVALWSGTDHDEALAMYRHLAAQVRHLQPYDRIEFFEEFIALEQSACQVPQQELTKAKGKRRLPALFDRKPVAFELRSAVCEFVGWLPTAARCDWVRKFILSDVLEGGLAYIEGRRDFLPENIRWLALVSAVSRSYGCLPRDESSGETTRTMFVRMDDYHDHYMGQAARKKLGHRTGPADGTRAIFVVLKDLVSCLHLLDDALQWERCSACFDTYLAILQLESTAEAADYLAALCEECRAFRSSANRAAAASRLMDLLAFSSRAAELAEGGALDDLRALFSGLAARDADRLMPQLRELEHIIQARVTAQA